METAAKVLIVGGVLNLALAFALGFVLSNSRLKEPEKPQHYLNLAHKVSLWEAFMLLGLVFAVELADLSSGVKTLAAALLVASSAFQDGSSVLNWLQGVSDEFAERSPGLVLATINAILATAGLAILIVGVFRGL
jgi:hypothetical protein